MTVTPKPVQFTELDYYTFEGKLIDNEGAKKLLGELPPNCHVEFFTDPSGESPSRMQLGGRDVVVNLIGPTNHYAKAPGNSLWRMEVINEVVNKRLREWLTHYPNYRLMFIVPQYADKRSLGFENHVEDELAWERKIQNRSDLDVIWYDLRLIDPAGGKGNADFTVSAMAGEAIARANLGYGNTISYTPPSSNDPSVKKEFLMEVEEPSAEDPSKKVKVWKTIALDPKSTPLGVDWVQEHSRCMMAQHLLGQGIGEGVLSKRAAESHGDAVDRITSQMKSNPEELAAECHLSVAELSGYATQTDEFYDAIASTIKRLMQSRSLSFRV